MPYYDFECNDCHRTLEKHQTFAEMEQTPSLPCECGGSMSRLIGTPHLMTDTRWFAGMGDGFGNDERSRRLAQAKARAAGVVTTGCTYFPQLCPTGETLSPQAWCHDRAEIRQKLQKLGRGAEGSINVKGRDADTDPKPYRVADSIVQREVRNTIIDNKLRPTPKQRREMTEIIRNDLTPAM